METELNNEYLCNSNTALILSERKLRSNTSSSEIVTSKKFVSKAVSQDYFSMHFRFSSAVYTNFNTWCITVISIFEAHYLFTIHLFM